MTLRNWLLAAAATAAACGSDGDDEPSIVGKWLAPASGDFACAVGLAFSDAGDYEYATLCELTDGSIGVESRLGSYVDNGDSVTLELTHSSCGGEPQTDDVSYAFVGDKLRLVTPAGVLVLERVPEGDAEAVTATYGCYASDGSFTASPVRKL